MSVYSQLNQHVHHISICTNDLDLVCARVHPYYIPIPTIYIHTKQTSTLQFVQILFENQFSNKHLKFLLWSPTCTFLRHIWMQSLHIALSYALINLLLFCSSSIYPHFKHLRLISNKSLSNWLWRLFI